MDPTGGAGAAPPGEAPPGDLLDAMGQGSPEPTGNPDDSVTRGQSDVVMDIVERTLASTGKGKTKSQQAEQFKLDQEEQKQEMGQAAAMGGPMGPGGAPAGPDGAPAGGGPMGALGGAMDPAAFGGGAKTAAEIEKRLLGA